MLAADERRLAAGRARRRDQVGQLVREARAGRWCRRRPPPAPGRRPRRSPAGARSRPSPAVGDRDRAGRARCPATAIAAKGFSVRGRRATSRRAPASPAAPPSTDASTSVRALRWSANAAASSTTTARAERAVGRVGSGRHVVAVREARRSPRSTRPGRIVTMLRIVACSPLRAVARKRVDRRRRADVGEAPARRPRAARAARLRAGRAIGDVGDRSGPASAPGRR